MTATISSEFSERRHKVMQSMQANSICIIPAANLLTRSRDTEFPFRQDSYFQYLCGFPEPDAYLLLSNHSSFGEGASILFCLAKDKEAEIWQGRRIGVRAAKLSFAMDMAFDLEQLEDKLPEFLDGHDQLYFALGYHEQAEKLVMSSLDELRSAPKQSKQAPSSIVDIRPILDTMRLYKSSDELAIMRQASDISTGAHKRAMRFAQAGKFEYQLAAEIHHEFAMHGAQHPAYGTIVGSGENACILHYTENSDELKDGALVLIDAGCELEGYAADITRTFPVSGKFSAEQKQLYQLVLDAQLAAFELINPGATIKQAADKAIEVLTQGLLDLGILHGNLAQNIQDLSYREYYMHGLSHWLGMDVHDVGAYKVDGKDIPLAPGMLLTVEPGLYIAPDAKVDQQWKGIGIRIEDNLLITESGHENLTQAAPKTIDDIEAFMASKGAAA